MFEKTFPEKVGIKSEDVIYFLNKLESRGLFMHSVIMARGNKIFCEAYWKPYTEKSLQRMYSITKSYVGIAISELIAEGRLSPEDKIVSFFPDKLPDTVHPYLADMTVGNMLTMQTCMTGCNWFGQNVTDRLKHYFAFPPSRYPGTGFDYDSEGSFVLCALLERLTGKTLLDYLKEICFDEMGFFKEARCLKAPGGHTWGDSALLCTARDQLAFARLIADGGKWNSRQLLKSEAVENAVCKHSDTVDFGIKNYDNVGYGYQVWRCFDGAFAFLGMHNQTVIYHPETDIIFLSTAGDPHGAARSVTIENFYNSIIRNASDKPGGRTPGTDRLEGFIGALKLRTAGGEDNSPFENEINKKRFITEENSMGIKEFTLSFDREGGAFTYLNRQGRKTIKFGRNKNTIQSFPETGYSKDTGGIRCEGHMYRCAASAGWIEEKRLSIIVQIIDDYVGLLNITVGFNGDWALLDMKKCAEDFLDEYSGSAVAKPEREQKGCLRGGGIV